MAPSTPAVTAPGHGFGAAIAWGRQCSRCPPPRWPCSSTPGSRPRDPDGPGYDAIRNKFPVGKYCLLRKFGLGLSMTDAPAAPGPAPLRRRDQQKEQTRLDLALAAFELARAEGLAQVRVPQIAAAVGGSTRTFNNSFSSKEAAIAWPTTLRGDRMARDLADRPAGEPLAGALVEVMGGMYGPVSQEGMPADWVDEFRAMVATEPALHGEFLKAQAAAEQKLAAAIADRTGAAGTDLEPLLLAGGGPGGARA